MGPALHEFIPNLGMTSLKNVGYGLVFRVSNRTLHCDHKQYCQGLNAEVKSSAENGDSPINRKCKTLEILPEVWNIWYISDHECDVHNVSKCGSK